MPTPEEKENHDRETVRRLEAIDTPFGSSITVRQPSGDLSQPTEPSPGPLPLGTHEQGGWSKSNVDLDSLGNNDNKRHLSSPCTTIDTGHSFV